MNKSRLVTFGLTDFYQPHLAIYDSCVAQEGETPW